MSIDSGDQTVVLLGQISQQLAGITNGTQSSLLANQHPDTAIILVNAMWLISLVLSITSALFATLLQQWARRYVQTPQIPPKASERARLRSFFFLGIQKNYMAFAVEIVPTLLHVSVFLFFGGLVIFFFTIHKTVAIAVTASVGVFAVIYLALTILPYILDKCLYRTPMSDLLWYPWHTFLFFATFCLLPVLKAIRSCRIPCYQCQGPDMIPTQEVRPTIHEAPHKKHWDYLKNGFQKSIIQGALHAQVDVDRDALTQLFSQLALADKHELLKVVANIPRDKIVHVMTPPIESGTIVFREPLTAIRDSIVGTSTGLDEIERKSCLLVWLTAVHHIAKWIFVNFSPNRAPETQLEDLLKEIRLNFADIGRMQPMWTHSDPAIRIISHSICALLAKCVLRKRHLSEAEIRWLCTVTGVSGNKIHNSMNNPVALDSMVLKSFVYGVFPHRESNVPNQAGDISRREGEVPRQEGDTPIQAGDISHREVEVPRQEGDTPDQVDDISHREVEVPRQEGGTPDQADDIPHREGEVPRQEGDTPNQADDISHREVGVSRQEGDIPDQASDTPHHDSDLTAHTSFIAKTLATLMGAGTEPLFDLHTFVEKLRNLIDQMEGVDPHASFVADELRKMFRHFILAPALAPTPLPAPAPVPAPAPAPARTSSRTADVLRRFFRRFFQAPRLVHPPEPPSGPQP